MAKSTPKIKRPSTKKPYRSKQSITKKIAMTISLAPEIHAKLSSVAKNDSRSKAGMASVLVARGVEGYFA